MFSEIAPLDKGISKFVLQFPILGGHGSGVPGVESEDLKLARHAFTT
jgi:hypothetical protein